MTKHCQAAFSEPDTQKSFRLNPRLAACLPKRIARGAVPSTCESMAGLFASRVSWTRAKKGNSLTREFKDLKSRRKNPLGGNRGGRVE